MAGDLVDRQSKGQPLFFRRLRSGIYNVVDRERVPEVEKLTGGLILT